MGNSSRFTRMGSVVVVVAATLLTVLWFLGDEAADLHHGELGSRSPSPRLPVVARETLSLPVAESSVEPGELSAVSVLAGEPGEQGTRVKPRRYGLRHASGAPGAGLRVAFQRDGTTMFVGESDADGRIDFVDVIATSGPPDRLWIGGATGLILESLPPTEASQDVLWVELPPGREIDGTVTVDGALPTRLVDLALRNSGSQRSGATPNELTRQRLKRADTHMFLIRNAANAQRITSDGRFRFSGLADGWSGRVHFSNEYSLDPAAHSPELNSRSLASLDFMDIRLEPGEPTTAIHLALITRPTLRGRAVWPDGSPVSGATVSSELSYGGTGWTAERTVSADRSAADGRFSIPCMGGPESTLELTLRSADGRGVASLNVSDTHRTHGGDLGDVVLQTLRRVIFRALDTKGEPIAGGIALSNDGSRAKSERTDFAGLASISLDVSSPIFTVHALEHESAEVFVPDNAPEVVDVVLEDCCVLRLQLGEPVPEGTLSWRLSAKGKLFTRGENFHPEEIRHELGMSRLKRATHSTHRASADAVATLTAGSATFAADSHELVLSCLHPGILFDVALTDVSGDQVVWEQQGLSLAAGEDRQIVAWVDVRARQFSGTIRDPQGRPIEGAQLYAGPAGGSVPSLGADSDAEGHFVVEGLLCEAVDFDCAMPGYLSIAQTNVPMPSDEGLQITLQPSRSMTVEITSPAPLTKGASVLVLVGGSQVFQAVLREVKHEDVPTPPHRYTTSAEAVAGVTATLHLEHRGRTYERQVPLGEQAVYWTLDEDF